MSIMHTQIAGFGPRGGGASNWEDRIEDCWYVHDAFVLIFSYMDHHAEREIRRLVKTEVFRQCQDAFDY